MSSIPGVRAALAWWRGGPRRLAPRLWPPAVLLLLACSHDAPRENPLDPELTPAVELTAALDDSAGTVILSWTRYDGRQPFGSYRIDRRIRGRTEWTTLDSISAPELTTFADSTLEAATPYEYRVAAVNAAGFAQPSDVELVPGFDIAAIALLPVVAQPGSGVLRLRWTGVPDPRFDRYTLIRRERATGEDTVVQTTGDPADTTFADSAARHGVTYDYRVRVTRAGQSRDSVARTATLSLPAVTLDVPAVESTSATVGLRWSTYSGPRFAAYEIRRSSPGLEAVSVATLDDRLQVSFVDSSLWGDTPYDYAVRVLTTRGETVDGLPATARIHGHAATWPLDVDDGDFVRLYREGDRGVTVLTAGVRGIRLRPLSRAGWGEEQVLLAAPVAHPATVATAPMGPDRRLVSMRAGDHLALLSYAADGRPILDHTLALDGFPPMPEEELEFAPVVSLTATGRAGSEVAVDRLTVRTAADEWTATFDDPLQESDWARIGSRVSVLGGHLRVSPGSTTSSTEMVTWSDTTSPVETVEVAGSLTGEESALTVQLGWYARSTALSSVLPRAPSVMSLTMDKAVVGVVFAWEYNTGRLSERQRRSDTLYVSIVDGAPYTLALGLQGGQPFARVTSPVLATFPHAAPVWAALGSPQDSVAVLSFNGQHVSVPRLAELDNGPPPDVDASEVRIRRRLISSTTPLEVGFCLPDRHQVSSRRAFLRARDGLALLTAIGQIEYGRIVGSGAGQLLFPLSFDWNEDTNVFVLDAGNARVQVFDGDGGYVTQWGGRGTGEGLFDFGEGNAPEDYFGSIALDAEGYIYVAEPLNHRIQIFAP